MRANISAVVAIAALASSTNAQAAVNPYAPTSTSCPAGGSLIRPADSLSSDEQGYIEQREPKATEALTAWLTQALPGISTEQLPKLALALSGGGAKAGLTTAGAVYGLDGRESIDSPVAGLLQSMTYISALSGGSLTLSGIMTNDFAQISTLRDQLLDASYENVFAAALANLPEVRESVGNKTAAGYPATLIDIYGRVLSYNYISPTGGNNSLWSEIPSQSSFQDHEAPFPIIIITQTNVANGTCRPNTESAVWEVSPFEFGSFDANVNAFYPTQYMGTSGDGNSSQCTTGFDNVGFITGISSNILVPDNGECVTGNFTADELNNTLAESINTAVSGVSLVNPYGIIPNPFYQAAEAGEIRDQQDIYGTDGGFDGQGIPIWPWLQPERAIDVIFVVDAISTQSGNITNGTAIYRTYTAAQRAGLRRMPLVPTPEEVVERNLTSGAQFYGCYDEEAATVIYLPNTELGDVPRANSFTDEEVDDGFDGGLAMVTQSQSGDSEWAACVACAIVHKNVTELPDVCTGCLERYCWPRDTMSGNGTTNGTEMTNGTETTNGSGTTPSSSSAPSESTSNAGTANIVRSTCLMVVAGVVLAFFL